MNILNFKIVIVLLIGGMYLSPIFSQPADFQQANEHYSRKSYDSAIVAYSQLVERGYSDAMLYYNLGNACFKNNQIGFAILWYERALRLSPNNKDIQYNLAFANQQTIDNIESIPPFFLKTWILAVQNLFSAKQWAIISIIFCILLICCILLIFIISKYRLRILFFTFSCLFLLATLSSIVFASMQTHRLDRTDEGIIIQSSVTVKSTPDDSGTDLFTVHEGTKVILTDNAGDWLEVQFGNGSKGWMLAENVMVI